jgi:hypothetical protein
VDRNVADLLPLLAGVDPAALGDVLDRIRAVVGDEVFAEALSAELPHPDPFVEVVARHLPAPARERLARDPLLTPDQLCVLIEADGGSGDLVRAVFHGPAAGPEPAAPPRPGAAGELDTARARLRSAECDAATAVALLREHPILAWTAREAAGPEPHRLLHDPDAPRPSVSAVREPLLRAVEVGAVTFGEVADRTRPARVAVQWLSWLWRERDRTVPRARIADHLRALTTPRLGTDPYAWAAFGGALNRHRGTLGELVADAAARAATADRSTAPAFDVPAAGRAAFAFTVRVTGPETVAALLPHLEGDLARAMLPGDQPPDPWMVDLVLATRHPALLGALADHQHLGDPDARRLAALDDRALDLVLAANTPGTTAAFRRDLLAGTVRGPEAARRPLDDDLRRWAVGAVLPNGIRRKGSGMPTSLEHSTLAWSGDPVLVTLGLPRCTRLRHIDQYDVLIGLWERSGPDGVTAVLTSLTAAERDAALAPKVRARLDEARAAGDPGVLRAERERLAARPKPRRARAPRAPEPWELPVGERIRRVPLDRNAVHWLPGVIARGDLPAADVVTHGHPAVHALAVLRRLGASRAAPADLAPVAGVTGCLGTRPDAWAVLVQLLPDFTGTLPELADVAVKAS